MFINEFLFFLFGDWNSSNISHYYMYKLPWEYSWRKKWTKWQLVSSIWELALSFHVEYNSQEVLMSNSLLVVFVGCKLHDNFSNPIHYILWHSKFTVAHFSLQHFLFLKPFSLSLQHTYCTRDVIFYVSM